MEDLPRGALFVHLGSLKISGDLKNLPRTAKVIWTIPYLWYPPNLEEHD